MRIGVVSLCLLAAACVAPISGRGATVTTTLDPADAATGILSAGALSMSVTTASAAEAAEAEAEGMDALIEMRLVRADGQSLAFTEANHTPYDLMAQAPGGPLAQAMGLFGEEAPKLYSANEQVGAPFLCQPDGPAYVGIYQGEDGSVLIVGLKSGFDYEPLPAGGYSPLPYSPDQVCARMRFTRR